MDYRILENSDYHKLVEDVKTHIYDGWDIVGGVNVCSYGPNNTSAIYTQAVVYYEKEGPKPLNVVVQNWPEDRVVPPPPPKLPWWKRLFRSN